ncbi:retinol dehydrogenase 13-like isoform X3 [Panicum virgatum]|uniref:retinol dehydrogenase 13-like isoform X3 n=1 Tax=Panicum virgatum TaxID=38727 RepID=UPI0019D57679|nr:retinol dehydrogenase 13-like isoform X3 [Panicum virgatum]
MDSEALRMVCSPQFWRMAVLWSISLLHSYLLVFLRSRAASTPGLRRPRPGAGRRQWRWRRRATTSCSTVQEIQRQQPDARLEAFQLDLASYKSIKKFGSSLKQWIQETNSEPAIQLLINNAGILAKSHRVTRDGLDEMIQTNYIGPFILTSILLPLLKNSSLPSRVVNLTSFTHRCVSGIDVSEDALRGMKFGPCSVGESYSLASTYEYTKLCILMFSYELHRQLHISSAVSVIAADPGVVETKIMRELPKCLSWFAFFVLRFLNLLQEPGTGVGSVLDAALAPPEESGKYFFGGKGRTIRSSRLSYHTEVAKKLWAESWAVFKDLQLREGDFGNG